MTKVYLENYVGTFYDDHVFFESNEFGEDDQANLWINKDKEIYDYEGCYEIPEEVMFLMTVLGYTLL